MRANSQPESQRRRLVFRVYNYADVSQQALGTSEKVAGAIFANAGVETAWVDCPLSKEEFRQYPGCQSEMRATDVVLRILPGSMAKRLQVWGEPLGFGQACPEAEPACEVSVFYDEVEKLARSGYRADLILGHVIAHEAGHVLLGAGHSQDGIMRAQWSSDDLQLISCGALLNFTNAQSSEIRDSVSRRAAPEVLAEESAASVK
jgi:hypothetical protein